MNRGDIVTVALQGEFGKPRPALVLQSDAFNASHATITVVPISSTIVPAPLFRITLEPSASGRVTRAKVAAFQSGFQERELDPFLTDKVAMKIDGSWVTNNIARFGKFVPVVGGVVAGGFDAAMTQLIGRTADRVFTSTMAAKP